MGNQDLAINVRNLVDFKKLMDILRADGYRWKDLTKPSEKNIDEWFYYEIYTCICCNKSIKEIYLSGIDLSLQRGYAVISFDTFFKKYAIKFKEDKTQNGN